MYYVGSVILLSLCLLSDATPLLQLIIPIILFRKLKNKDLLLFLSLLIGCFSGLSVRVYNYLPQPIDAYNKITNQNISVNIFTNILAVLISIFFIIVLVRTLEFLKLSYFRGLMAYIFICLLSLYILNFISIQYKLNSFLLVTIIFFIKQFPYILLIIGYKNYSLVRFKNFLYIILPVWDTSPVARPEIMLPISKKPQNILDKEAFHLVSFFVVLLFIDLIFRYTFLYDKFYGLKFDFLPFYKVSAIQKLILEFAQFSKIKIIFNILVYAIPYLLGILTVPLAVDAAYRLLGFEPLRQYYNPLKSKSGGDAYNRMMPYYTHTLNFIFVFPIYKKLKYYMKSKVLCYNISLFSGIFIFGYFSHLFKDLSYFVQYDFLTILSKQFFSWFFVSVLIFIIVKFFNFDKNRFTNCIKVTTMLFLIGIIMIFRNKPMEATVSQKFELLRYLLFL